MWSSRRFAEMVERHCTICSFFLTAVCKRRGKSFFLFQRDRVLQHEGRTRKENAGREMDPS